MQKNKITSGFVILSFLIAGASCDPAASLFARGDSVVQPLPTYNIDELVSRRDSDPSYDEGDAARIVLSEGNVRITEAGTYILEGTLTGSHIEIDAGDEDKIQLVLGGVDIECSAYPAIDIVNADKVFITLKEGTYNRLSVTGSSDLNSAPDAIHSKDDLTLNGSGTLEITSTANAITCSDEVVVTGGTYDISCSESAIQTEESVVITDADINVSSCYDGLHAEGDDTSGFIVISGGNIYLDAEDDAIHASSSVTILGGQFDLSGSECIESTYVRIDDGLFLMEATGDGINAGRKTDSYDPVIEINGGDFTIEVAPGDTDGIDSNGDLTITGGIFTITADSPFDWDGELIYTGGIIKVNGRSVSAITNQDP